MTYKAHRDYRFEYAHEVLDFIESNQCYKCKFKEIDDPEMPMCIELSGKVMLEEPVEEFDDVGDEGIVCRKYEVMT